MAPLLQFMTISLELGLFFHEEFAERRQDVDRESKWHYFMNIFNGLGTDLFRGSLAVPLESRL